MQFLAVAALAGLAVASPVADNGYASYGTYDGAGAKGPYASYGSYKGAGQGGSSPPPTTPNPTGPQIPFKFPLPNGFPNIAVPSDALNAISKQARGTLPNGALPTKLSDDSATQLQVIAANELFEVAYFTSLINNITDGTYDVGSGAVKNIVLDALTAVQAQEQLHAIGANAILASAGRTTIQPCQYVFPVADFDSAIALAGVFTDVVLGTLQGTQAIFSQTGDGALIPLVGSIIGQEAQQVGYYRSLGRKIPSELPFLTRSSGIFAASVLAQTFIVPGSCGNIDVITSKVPILMPLTLATPVTEAKDQTVTFSIPAASAEGLSLVYVSQQNMPIVEPISNVQTSGNTTTFTANFPYSANLLNGLTIAAVTKSAGPFADADAVAAASVYGPGLIDL